jgi:hypothetical protein
MDHAREEYLFQYVSANTWGGYVHVPGDSTDRVF